MKKFNNLKEALIGIEFQSIGWDFPLLYGLFYEKIKDTFHKPQFIQPLPVFVKNTPSLNHPRLIFSQKKSDGQYKLTLQVQENKFVVNCHYKENITDNSFNELFENFNKYLNLFKKCYKSIENKNLQNQCLLTSQSFDFIESVNWTTHKDFLSKFPSLSGLLNFQLKQPYFSFDFIKEKNNLTFNIAFSKNNAADNRERFIVNFNAFNLFSNDTGLEDLVLTMNEELDTVINENYKRNEKDNGSS